MATLPLAMTCAGFVWERWTAPLKSILKAIYQYTVLLAKLFAL
jgi:hypothetical protein